MIKKFFIIFFGLPLFIFGKVFAQNETVLSLQPPSSSRQVGELFALEAKLSTLEKILAADIDISYNIEFIEAQKVTPANFFNNPQILTNEIDPKKGLIKLSLFSYPERQATATIAVITFRALKETTESAKINFESTTVLATVGTKKIIFKTTPADIKITQKTISLLPSRTLLPTGYVSPISFSTPTPTPIPPRPSLIAKLAKPLATLLIISGAILFIFALVIL